MALRRVTYRLYPTATQDERMHETHSLHQRLYNTALEERIKAWKRDARSLTYTLQCKVLTLWRKLSSGLASLNAQSEQVTLKRLDLAFQHFFRRVRNGEKPGFPRFKSRHRFPGWGYKTHGDGWKLHAGQHGRHGTIYLQGIGTIRIRGKARTPGIPVTCDIMMKAGRWHASVALECMPERTPGTRLGAFDWGVEPFLTVATADGIATVENPRHLRLQLQTLQQLGRAVTRKIRATLRSPSKPKRMPRSVRLKTATASLGRLHAKIARQRKDFLHQTSARLIREFGALATEQLSVANMTKHGGSRKKGLNREVLSVSPSALLTMIRTKAEEAGSWFKEAPTRSLKPTQRCHACWTVPDRRKTLNDRSHSCACDARCGRDDNAALVLLRWLDAQLSGREPSEAWSGVRPWGSPMAPAMKRETPAIAG